MQPFIFCSFVVALDCDWFLEPTIFYETELALSWGFRMDREAFLGRDKD
jgi:hypothetical protein